jgi:uncharacterized protein YbaP (TraB family)
MRLLAVLLLPAFALAQTPPQSPPTTMRTLVVTGQQPGPGLWKVSGHGHLMWVFGTLSPLPKRMEWTSTAVEQAIAQSSEVIRMPTVDLTVKGAALGGLFLIPSLLKARNNPGKETLQDVLPPAVYARWAVLKKKYLGRDNGVEKRRPLMAAQKLDEEAMDDSGLTYSTKVMKVVERAAKKHKVTVTQPKIDMQIEDAKQLVQEFSKTSLDDIECFDKTLQRLEQDIETTRLRANAWSLGEIDILRTLPFTDNRRACADAVLATTIARRAGFTDIEARMETLWLDAAEAALAKNERSFAVLPMSLVLKDDGWLAKLAARGYTVEAPAQRE